MLCEKMKTTKSKKNNYFQEVKAGLVFRVRNYLQTKIECIYIK